jgi:hypothetical protein
VPHHQDSPPVFSSRCAPCRHAPFAHLVYLPNFASNIHLALSLHFPSDFLRANTLEIEWGLRHNKTACTFWLSWKAHTHTRGHRSPRGRYISPFANTGASAGPTTGAGRAPYTRWPCVRAPLVDWWVGRVARRARAGGGLDRQLADTAASAAAAGCARRHHRITDR